MTTRINLSQLVEQVRNELEAVDRNRAGESRSPLLKLQQLELEVKVVVDTTETIGSGFDIKIVTLKGEETSNSQAVQTVKLTYGLADSKKPLPGSRAHHSAETGPAEEVDFIDRSE